MLSCERGFLHLSGLQYKTCKNTNLNLCFGALVDCCVSFYCNLSLFVVVLHTLISALLLFFCVVCVYVVPVFFVLIHSLVVLL